MPTNMSIFNNPLKPPTAKGTMNQKKYLNFPIFMLNATITDPRDGMTAIESYSIYSFAMRLSAGCHHALVQAAYVKTRRPDENLPANVRRIMARTDITEFVESCDQEAWLDPDGFTTGATAMLKESDIRLDSDEQASLETWLKLRDALKYFNRIVKNYDGFKRRCEELQTAIDRHASTTGKLAPANVPADYFYETLQNPANIEAMRLFRMVCAVRSLIGKKKFTGTTKDMLRARMIGAKTTALAATVAAGNRVIKREMAALQSRKRFDRILTEAAVRGFFTKLGMGRRIYLSTDPDLRTPEKLAACVKAKFNRHQRYKDAERAARQGAAKGQ